MGGSSKKVTVGYKYHLGMHIGLCHGPIDFITRIMVDSKTAWEGFEVQDQTISISKPGLFGGEKKEGGLEGDIDILLGSQDQLQNSYLQSQLGTNIPAFRGIGSIVLKEFYLGMNPYLKAWKVRAQRILSTSDGAEQWYQEKAIIGIYKPVALYFAMDLSGSMATSSGGLTRLQLQAQAINNTLERIRPVLVTGVNIDIAICGFGESPATYSYLERRNVSSGDITDLQSFVNSSGASMNTYFPIGVAEAPDFFSGTDSEQSRYLFFITDGAPSSAVSSETAIEMAVATRNTINSIPGVASFGINIELVDTTYTQIITNTGDPVPVIDAGNVDLLTRTIVSAIVQHQDMNPAHIIYECLTNKVWGMGYPQSSIGDFEEAADQLYAEAMGISLLWDRQLPIEEFINEIIRHINAALIIDRVTGQYVLKLIRGDYVAEDLLVLDETNIRSVKDYKRTAVSDPINSVTVKHWDYETGQDSSVTAEDLGSIQQLGTTVNTTIQYPGFTNASLALRAAQRDLKMLSSSLLSCVIEANREAASLSVGDVFAFGWEDYHTGVIPMRILQIGLGSPSSNRVKITCVQDVFSLPDTSFVSTDDSGWTDIGGEAAPITSKIVMETPYYLLVTEQGQTTVDNLLSTTPEIGYLLASAGRPVNGLTAEGWVDPGSGFEEAFSLDFCPTAEITNPLAFEDTVVTIQNPSSVSELGSFPVLAMINSEIISVSAYDSVASEITIRRGMLDTIPPMTSHPAESTILFFDGYEESDETEYVSGEEIDVKLSPSGSLGEPDLADILADSVTFSARAVRPYNVADAKFNGEYLPVGELTSVEVTFVWRNRLQQTDADPLGYFDAGVSAEAGTEVNIRVLTAEGAEHTVITGIASSPYTLTDLPTSGAYATLEVYTVRDGFRSWQNITTTIMLPSGVPGDNLDFVLNTGYTPPTGDSIDFTMEPTL